MSELRFNVNSYVRVRLTDHGRKLHRQGWEKWIAQFPNFPDYVPPKEDAGGWSEWQLWDLMNVFGPFMGNGRETPFETEIVIPTPDGGQQDG